MIALTVVSPDINSEMDPRFGRAAYLLLVDPKTMSWTSMPNPGKEASGGAGVRLAQLLSEKKVEAVISGRFGPKAADALEKAGIAMESLPSASTAQEALDHWKGRKEKPSRRLKPLDYLASRK